MKDLRSEIEQATEEWSKTLRKWGCARPIMASEMLDLGRAVQQHGVEFVLLALQGAREEQASGDFNPGDYLSLKRIFKPENFPRFVNLGSRARNRSGAVSAPVARPADDPVGVPMTPEAKKLLRGIGIIKGGRSDGQG